MMRQRQGFVLQSVLFLLMFLGVFSLEGCAERPTYSVDYAPPTEFFIGPEDILIVTVWKNQDLSREVIVRPDGLISMPLIGDVAAAGLTSDVLARLIAERLTEFMASPTVSVQVKEVNSYFIYVMGEVQKPGKYPLKSYSTVMQGITLAGGFTPFASKNKMQVIRATKNGKEVSQTYIPVRYSEIVAGKPMAGNFYLKSGDVIVVP